MGPLERLRASASADGPEIVYLFWPTIMGYLRIVTHPLRRSLRPLESRADAIAKCSSALIAAPHVRTPGEDEGLCELYLATRNEARSRQRRARRTPCRADAPASVSGRSIPATGTSGASKASSPRIHSSNPDPARPGVGYPAGRQCSRSAGAGDRRHRPAPLRRWRRSRSRDRARPPGPRPVPNGPPPGIPRPGTAIPDHREAADLKRRSRRRTIARVGGNRRTRPKMSVMKPGVSSRVPPITIITPSATSLPGKRRCASASLKRRQAPRPWWRSRNEPSRASASSRARVGQTPIACADLDDHVELRDRHDDEEDDEQGHTRSVVREPRRLGIGPRTVLKCRRVMPAVAALAASSSSASDS